MNAIILGDSHVVALKEAWESLPSEERIRLAGAEHVPIGMLAFGAKFLKPFHVADENELRFTGPDMGDAFERLSPGSGGAIRRGDGRHFVVSLGFHGVALYNSDVWRSWTVGKTMRDKRYVSRAAFREMVLDMNKHILSFYDAMTALDLEFTVMAAAPLPRTYLDGAFHTPFEDGEILDMRNSYVEAFAGILDGRCIRYVLPPADVTEGGFLRAELGQTRQPGDFHGNAAYGSIFLRKLLPGMRTENRS
ncbi:MAG: hypothetical protein J7507_16215 [Pseudoxanthomonas sp.]|nr:hypothetical protein [Pseudoxanthomonas sp.]